jgi:hypothetical protein
VHNNGTFSFSISKRSIQLTFCSSYIYVIVYCEIPRTASV